MARASGFVLIEGTDDQVMSLMKSEEYTTRLFRAMTTNQHVMVQLLDAGDRVTKRIEQYGMTLKQLGI
jgi:hypothetical protein